MPTVGVTKREWVPFVTPTLVIKGRHTKPAEARRSVLVIGQTGTLPTGSPASLPGVITLA